MEKRKRENRGKEEKKNRRKNVNEKKFQKKRRTEKILEKGIDKEEEREGREKKEKGKVDKKRRKNGRRGSLEAMAYKQWLIYRRDGTVPHVGGVGYVFGRWRSMVVAIGFHWFLLINWNRFE